jgi:stage II sporulation protein P
MRIVANKNKGMHFCTKTAAALATVVAVVCFAVRLTPQISAHGDAAALTAAGFIMPQGGAEAIKTGFAGNDKEDSGPIAPSSSAGSQNSSSQPTQSGTSASSDTASQSTSSATAQSGLGTAYPIKEMQMADNGTQYQGIYLKNNTDKHSVNIAEELKKQPAVKIKTDGTPQVLIYHTHTTESYMNKLMPFFYSSFATRTQDNTQNVVAVGNAIEAELKAAGIGVIHDITVHDYPSYNGSYYRSEDTMKKVIKKYPSIQVTLDIHRDAMGGSSGSRIKPTVTVNGKKAAQLMIVSGCDDDGTQEFPNWEYNLRFALRLQQSTAKLYPGLARPIDFCNAQYNENRTKGSLLVEFGTEVNTVDEATYSGTLFGKSLVSTLKTLK